MLTFLFTPEIWVYKVLQKVHFYSTFKINQKNAHDAYVTDAIHISVLQIAYISRCCFTEVPFAMHNLFYSIAARYKKTLYPKVSKVDIRIKGEEMSPIFI